MMGHGLLPYEAEIAYRRHSIAADFPRAGVRQRFPALHVPGRRGRSRAAVPAPAL